MSILQPDVIHDVTDDTTPAPRPQPEPDETPCICRNLDGIGQNPTCQTHPWWRRDPTVLHTAALTQQGTPAWEAAAKVYGGDAR